MAKTQILDYYIHFTDKATADRLQAEMDSAPPTGPGDLIVLPDGTLAIYRAPNGAATEFAIEAGTFPPQFGILEVGDPIPTGVPGYIMSPWFQGGSNSFPRDVATFTIHNGWWIFGSNTKFYWAGHIVYSPDPATTGTPPVGVEPTTPADIPVRAWINGGELPSAGSPVNGMTVAGSLFHSRGASRLPDGYGMSIAAAGSTQRQILLTYSVRPRNAWTRIYFQIDRLPDIAEIPLWRGTNFSVGGSGMRICINVNGKISLWFSTGGAFTQIAEYQTLTVGQWYLLDVLFDIDGPNNVGTTWFYLNHVFVATGTFAPGGVAINRAVLSITIGKENGTTTQAQFNFDDCVLALPPVTRDPSIAAWDNLTAYVTGNVVRVGSDSGSTFAPRYKALSASTGQAPGGASNAFWIRLADSVDWQLGSHMQLLAPRAMAASNAWVGDYRMLVQRPDQTTRSNLTSTTALQRLAVTTDMARDVESVQGWLGWASLMVGFYNQRGTTSGTLGLTLNGTDILTAIVQAGALGWNGVMYSPTGLGTPTPAGSVVELVHVKGNDATTGRAAILQAQVESIGVFREEDLPIETSTLSPPPPTLPPTYAAGIHNAPYQNSPWALNAETLGPVQIVGGTYVGNGTGQQIAFQVPPVWIWVRNTAGGQTPSFLFTSHLDSHVSNRGAGWTALVKLEQDLTFVQPDPEADQQTQWLVHLAGADARINQNAVTYQYVAFCDPAARYSRAAAGIAANNVLPSAVALDSIDGFTPEVAFVSRENVTADTAIDTYFKGIGYSAAGAQNIGATAQITPAITLGADTVTLDSALVVATDVDNFPMVGFRRHDGNNDINENSVMFMGSYVGDGTASKVVNFSPGGTGRRPLWVIVLPVGGATAPQVRDPTNAATQSYTIGSGVLNTTSIIAGGVDSMTVGPTLNVNLQLYSYFGFYADASSCNGGWGCNGIYTPVPSDSPNPPHWSEPVIIPSSSPPLCADDWGTTRSDGLPYVPLMPGDTQTELQ